MEPEIRSITDDEKNQLDTVYSRIVEQDFPEYSQRVRDYFTHGSYKEQMIAKPIRLGAYVDGKLVGFILAADPDGVSYLFSG